MPNRPPLPAALALDPDGFPTANGRPLPLPPKERAVLALLLQRRPAVVSKEAFAGAAWPGGSMSDESLARSISRLRRTLAPWGLAIESVYGTGYRLESEPAAAGHTRLSGATHASPATVEAYLHARQLAQQRTPAAIGRAIDLLRELSGREPGYTPARVALAEALAAAVGWGQLPTDAAVAEGLRVLDEARTLDPATPGLAGARGTLLDMAWRFDEAAAAHDEALQHGTPDADTLLVHARHLLFTGQAERAVAQLRAARRLSPHAPLLRMTLSRALVQAGRGAEAVAEAQAAVAEHPGQLLLVAFELAMRAQVAPVPEMEAPAWRLGEGPDTPPFVWTVQAWVFARLGRREPALDIIDTSLICSRTSTGEATLYVPPLAALGEHARAAALLQRAYDERCGMLAMVLRDPANAVLLGEGGAARHLMPLVFGRGVGVQ
ncbi:MAG: winged helix-turn-helix domain-containing protein [Vitreoscilla sp.]|nr:winged helix-turn-helix domain-containing protein [Vitreoscilla sp.]